MLEVLGLLGGIGFAVSGLPTAYKSLKLGRTEFIPRTTQWSVFIGSILMIVYLTINNGFDWIVILDYSLTILSWAIILYYEYFPKIRSNHGDKDK